MSDQIRYVERPSSGGGALSGFVAALALMVVVAALYLLAPRFGVSLPAIGAQPAPQAVPTASVSVAPPQQRIMVVERPNAPIVVSEPQVAAPAVVEQPAPQAAPQAAPAAAPAVEQAAPAAEPAPVVPQVQVVRIEVQPNPQEGSAPIVTGSGACQASKSANRRCAKP